jgi:hypothetical protein
MSPGRVPWTLVSLERPLGRLGQPTTAALIVCFAQYESSRRGPPQPPRRPSQRHQCPTGLGVASHPSLPAQTSQPPAGRHRSTSYFVQVVKALVQHRAAIHIASGQQFAEHGDLVRWVSARPGRAPVWKAVVGLGLGPGLEGQAGGGRDFGWPRRDLCARFLFLKMWRSFVNCKSCLSNSARLCLLQWR